MQGPDEGPDESGINGKKRRQGGRNYFKYRMEKRETSNMTLGFSSVFAGKAMTH